MMRMWKTLDSRLVDGPSAASRDALLDSCWIDLEAPSREEELLVEAALGIEVPTEADMAEIEPSSRIHVDDGALYMTAQVMASPDPAHFETAPLTVGPVTFIVTPERLVTLHHHHPGSFAYFANWASHHDTRCGSGIETFLGLTETVVDRLADLLEGEARRALVLSKRIFSARNGRGRDAELSRVIVGVGEAEERNSMIADSISTLLRVMSFLSGPTSEEARRIVEGIEPARREMIERDLRSLAEVVAIQADKIRFLLDATLGVINIRQSDIIKIFSVVAFVFLPPTLIASIYGMNFAAMPELDWPWAYPVALLAMLVSAVTPWLFFRWKGWF